MKRQNKMSKFYKGLTIYALIFLAVIVSALTVFWCYMADYQKNLSETELENYITSLDKDKLATLLNNSTSDMAFNDFENWSSIINNLTKNEPLRSCVYSKNAKSTTSAPIYDISIGGIKIASVYLNDSGNRSAFGFTKWDIVDVRPCESFTELEKFNLCLSFPEDIDCTVNGKKLDGINNIKKIPYKSSSPFEADTSELPDMLVYQIPDFYVTPEIETISDSGKSSDYTVLFTKSDSAENEISAKVDFSENSSHRYILTINAPSNATVYLDGIKVGDSYKKAEQELKYYDHADDPFNSPLKNQSADVSLPVSVVYQIEGLLTSHECTATIRGTEITDSSKTKDEQTGDETYIFDYPDVLLYTYEIHTPSEYDVYVNGVKLEEHNLSEKEHTTDFVEGFEEYVKSPLTVAVYKVENLYNEADIKIVSNDGQKEIGYTVNNDGHIVAENTKSPGLYDIHNEMVSDVIMKYIEYSVAGYSDTNMAKYYTILNQTLPDSPAYDMVVSSRFSFAQNIPCRIESVDIITYDYYKWGENCFSCFVDFTIDMYNFSKVHDEVKGVNMFFVLYNDEWKLAKMIYT